MFLAYSAWFVHAVVSFAVEIGFNTSLYIERYYKTGVWIIPSEIRAALAVFITYICLSYCLIFYSMGMSIWRLNKINLAGNPQAKLNLKIIAIHLIALLLTVSSLMFYLGFASSYVSPDGTCDRKLEMFEQMPRVLCVFEIMQFLSQMVIYSIVYMYTTATQELQSVLAKTQKPPLPSGHTSIASINSDQVEESLKGTYENLIVNKEVQEYLIQGHGQDMIEVMLQLFKTTNGEIYSNSIRFTHSNQPSANISGTIIDIEERKSASFN